VNLKTHVYHTQMVDILFSPLRDIYLRHFVHDELGMLAACLYAATYKAKILSSNPTNWKDQYKYSVEVASRLRSRISQPGFVPDEVVLFTILAYISVVVEIWAEVRHSAPDITHG
jgi:hypothetical protein